MHELPPIEFEEAMQSFLFDCIQQIHQLQDPARFFRWVKENYSRYFADFIDTNSAEEVNAISLSTTRPIWNVTPLKSNHYQPKPLPKMGRNDRCYCGSGRKYKQCCQVFETQIPTLSTEEIWPILIEILSEDELKEVISLKVMPITALIEIAEHAFDDGELEFCCQTLEMLLSDESIALKEAADPAVNLLCNALDDLGEKQRKHERLAALSKSDDKWKSSSAYQRIASISLDAGKPDKAWDSFKTAQRLTPNSPMLDLLELSLLIGEHKYQQAQQRAKTIKHKWIKNQHDQDYPETFVFIERVILEPEKLLLDGYSEQDRQTLDRLQSWVLNAEQNPVALDYKLETFKSPAIETDPFARETQCFLAPPTAVQRVEKIWLDVFLDEKPFLTEIMVESKDYFQSTSEWLSFLEENPLAYNSMSILDDIVTHLQAYEGLDFDPTFDNILNPIYQQVANILAIGGDEKLYDWSWMENRPLLRILMNQLHACWRRGESRQATSLAQQLLRLNPNDNQGIRSLLMNAYLEQSEYQQAVDLAQIYDDSFFPEISLGKVLALYQLGQLEAAEAAWLRTKSALKHAKRYLTASSLNPPKFNEEGYGITIGSKEQMWVYRQEMREIWLRARGIMKWLKSL